MMQLVDAHCHVHFNAYKQDMEDIIQDALAENTWMITVGTQKDTSKKGIEVARQYDGVWATVGLHPNHLFPVMIDEDEAAFMTREEDFDYAYYVALATDPKVVAIGECGLDYYRIPETRDRAEVEIKQEKVFRQHLDVADAVNKPVMIHCRDAHSQTATILEEYVNAGKLKRRGNVHCFTGTWEEAARYHALGFLTSFTGVITFPPKKNTGETESPIQSVVRQCPLDMMLVETDAPYLTPVPFRGKRNHPKYVRYVAQTIADLKGISLEEVARATTQNARELFGLD